MGEMKPEQAKIPMWHAKSSAGGSLTVIGREHRMDNIGKVLQNVGGLGLPAFIFGKDIHKTYSEIAEKLFDYWKDVPWKGNVLVKIKPASVKEDIARYYEVLGKTPQEATFVDKFVHVPQLVAYNLLTRFFRASHYQDYTHSVTLYNKSIPVGMHELGHALDFDPHVSGLRETHTYKIPPNATGIKGVLSREWKASANAMKQFRNDDERRQAMKQMEPAYGTYIGDALGKIASLAIIAGSAAVIALNPVLIPAHILAYSLGAKVGLAALLSFDVMIFARTIGIFAGAIGAKIASALRSRRSTFGYVFEEQRIEKNVMFVGSAKPAYAFSR